MTSKGRRITVVVLDKKRKIAPSVRNALIEPIRSFREVASFASFIERQAKEDPAVVLITTVDDKKSLGIFQSMASVEAILVLSIVKKDLEILPSKVTGVYLQIGTILRVLPDLLHTLEEQLDANSLLFHRHVGICDNPLFYFYHLWRNQTRDQPSSRKIFVQQARLLFLRSSRMRAYIDDFDKAYHSSEVLAWLDRTRHPFPYHALIDRALRTHNEQILSLVRFFIDDMMIEMIPTPLEPTQNQFYLGTKLNQSLIDRLEKYRSTDAVAFQCFLSVTQSMTAALRDAKRPSRRQDLTDVLFKIEMKHIICLPLGDRILIDMATPFRIKYVTRNVSSTSNQQLLIVVKLTAIDPEEKERMYELYQQRLRASETKSESPRRRRTPKLRDDEVIADELIVHCEWARAAQILSRISNPSVRVLNKLGCLLRDNLHDLPGALNCYELALAGGNDRERAETHTHLGKVHHCLKQYETAREFYTTALAWYENEDERDPVMVARCLVGLGSAHRALGQPDDALGYAERALAIREHDIKPRNDFDVAACLGNLGNILHDQNDTQRGLWYAERAVALLTACGQGDPRLAAALNNLGAMHQSNGDLAKAREYFERALECLPSEDHPHGESTLDNLAQLETAEKLEAIEPVDNVEPIDVIEDEST